MEENRIVKLVVCLEEAELKMSSKDCYSHRAPTGVYFTAGEVSCVEDAAFVCCVQTLAS